MITFLPVFSLCFINDSPDKAGPGTDTYTCICRWMTPSLRARSMHPALMMTSSANKHPSQQLRVSLLPGMTMTIWKLENNQKSTSILPLVYLLKHQYKVPCQQFRGAVTHLPTIENMESRHSAIHGQRIILKFDLQALWFLHNQYWSMCHWYGTGVFRGNALLLWWESKPVLYREL